jgi:chemotaxis protein methyltransferase CheR
MMHLHKQGNITKILIENDISSDKELNQFHKALLESSNDTFFEITFIDIKSVSDIIVKALFHIKNRVQIMTTESVLWSYLFKFGIRNKYQNSVYPTEAANEAANEAKKAIVIGGSAGSIETLLPIVKAIPYAELSIFIVIHILPDRKSNLREIVQHITGYKVVNASNNLEIKTGHIYIATPDHHMVISDGHIYIDKSEAVNYARPAIDNTFKSLSSEYKNSLLAILLCGYGRDGSDSLKYLKNNGSEIIIQNPLDCVAKDMPQNAIETKHYHQILDSEKIRYYIKSTLRVNVDIKDQVESFLENINIVYGYDFTSYDRSSLSRRIKLLMDQNSINSFKHFERLIFSDDKFFNKLLGILSINVTKFFRNPDVFESMKKEVIPYINSFPSIRIWCAGCSKGDEPYSIAIMLDEMGLLHKSQIYATDFNRTILSEAENAMYTMEEFNESKKNYLQSGGKKAFETWFDMNENYVQLKKSIRNKVIFFKHNLVSDSSINEFNLIFCRNVLIYFDKSLQQKVFNLIDESLIRNTFLILGQSEALPEKYNYKTIGDKKNKIYKKAI